MHNNVDIHDWSAKPPFVGSNPTAAEQELAFGAFRGNGDVGESAEQVFALHIQDEIPPPEKEAGWRSERGGCCGCS